MQIKTRERFLLLWSAMQKCCLANARNLAQNERKSAQKSANGRKFKKCIECILQSNCKRALFMIRTSEVVLSGTCLLWTMQDQEAGRLQSVLGSLVRLIGVLYCPGFTQQTMGLSLQEQIEAVWLHVDMSYPLHMMLSCTNLSNH